MVEQSCAYQDLDGLDAGSLHLRVFDAAGSLAAYARLLPPGLDFPLACSVGRIVTGPDHRGQGYGKVLVGEALTRCTLLWPEADVVIRAQTYLLNFYHEFGFAAEGEPFLEDGIPHQQMRRSATRAS